MKFPSGSAPKIQVVLGTRPEVIKMAPVIRALRVHPAGFEIDLCVVAQQREVLDRALDEWSLRPDRRVELATDGRRLGHHVAAMLAGVDPCIRAVRADILLVHGDTSTAFATSLAAFYAGVPFGHVEAGLRTSDLGAPFPEELHRVVIDRMAAVHYAPTERARRNLLAEGRSDDTIAVVGNTVVDALRSIPSRCAPEGDDVPFILVTGHRRESFGERLRTLCSALLKLVRSRERVRVVYVLHPHPSAQAPVRAALGDQPRIALREPLSYSDFVSLLRRAHIVLTDSGGVQEEAASLGRPVLVLRERTERLEGVDQGISRVVPTDPDAIVRAVSELLDDGSAWAAMARGTESYGDGHASDRIVADLAQRFGIERCA